MSKGVNYVLLIGNVGKDPDVRFTGNGNAVANFSVATSESYKFGDEWKTATEWHNIVAWGKTAEYIGENVQKGDKVVVIGKLKTDSWEDKKTGDKKYKTQIVVDKFFSYGGGGGEKGDDEEERPRSTGRPRGQQKQAPISDEDIPF